MEEQLLRLLGTADIGGRRVWKIRAHSVCISMFSPGPFQPAGVCEGCWKLQQENGGRPSGPDHRRRPLPHALPAETGGLCCGATLVEGPIQTPGLSGKNAVLGHLSQFLHYASVGQSWCGIYFFPLKNVHFGRIVLLNDLIFLILIFLLRSL